MTAVEGKSTCSEIKIKLYMFNHGENDVKFLLRVPGNYFPKFWRISGYFYTKYTLVQIEPVYIYKNLKMEKWQFFLTSNGSIFMSHSSCMYYQIRDWITISQFFFQPNSFRLAQTPHPPLLSYMRKHSFAGKCIKIVIHVFLS